MGIRHNVKNFNGYIDKFTEICESEQRIIGYLELTSYGLPSIGWFKNHFSDIGITNYKNLTRFCGLLPSCGMNKADCDKAITKMIGKYGEYIKYDDFRNPSFGEISISLVNRFYGSLNNMKEEFGLPIIQENMLGKIKTEEEMISDLLKLSVDLGRTPKSREIDDCEYCSNSCTYFHKFGSVNKAIIKSGLETNKELTAFFLSDEEVISQYKEFIESLRYVPSYEECKSIQKLASPKTVCKRLNMTWNEFISSLGYKPNEAQYGNKCYANDGEKCLSQSERNIHNALLTIGIKNIKKEVLYNDFLVSFKIDTLKRCDWCVFNYGQKYIIEYFGLMSNNKYAKKHDKKLEFISKDKGKDYKFIALYPNDLKNIDEILTRELNITSPNNL